MRTIYYDKDGWVCNRYPYDIVADDESRKIEVSEEDYQKTFVAELHFAWRVRDNTLVCERYEETPQEETILFEIKDLKKKLADTDYLTMKYIEGRLSASDWETVKAQRQTWRNRINELSNQLT